MTAPTDLTTWTGETPVAEILTTVGVTHAFPGDMVAFHSRRLGVERVGIVLDLEPVALGYRAHSVDHVIPWALVAIVGEDGESGEVRRVRLDKVTVVDRAPAADEPLVLADCIVRDIELVEA